MKKFLMVAAVACLSLGLAVETASAAPRGGGSRGGYGGGSRGGYGGGYGGGYHGGYGGGYRGGYGEGYRGGYGGYGYNGIGIGIGSGYYGGYGYNRPYYGGSYGSSYGDYSGVAVNPTYYYPDTTYNLNTVQPAPIVYGADAASGIRQSSYSPAESNTRATINVKVPDADATVFFDDAQTMQKGTDRVFNTPALEPSKAYTYTIRVTWMDNGKEVTRSKDVRVEAGRETTVEFR